MEASVLDLRKKMREVLAAIDRHERVTITVRGHRRAVLVPISSTNTRKVKVAELPAFGMWAERGDMANPVEYIETIRRRRRY